MLQNLQNLAKFQRCQLDMLVDFAFLLAKIGADTTENERNFAAMLPKIGNSVRWSEVARCREGPLRAVSGAEPAVDGAHLEESELRLRSTVTLNSTEY